MFTVTAEENEEADRKAPSERRAKRKTKRTKSLNDLLSPIKQERLPPSLRAGNHQLHESRPDLLNRPLSWNGKVQQQYNILGNDSEDTQTAMDEMDDIPMPPLTRVKSRIDSQVSRPNLTFTTHLIDFLKLQHNDASTLKLPEANMVFRVPSLDVDDPISPLTKTQNGESASVHQDSQTEWIDKIYESANSDYLVEEQDIDDVPIISPRRNAWDWTGEQIGVALRHPSCGLENELLRDEMQVNYSVW